MPNTVVETRNSAAGRRVSMNITQNGKTYVVRTEAELLTLIAALDMLRTYACGKAA